MKYAPVFFLFFVCSCGGSSYDLPEVLPHDLYKQWIEARIVCDHKLSMAYLSTDCYDLNTAASLKQNCWFDCKEHEFVLHEFESYEIPIDESDSLHQRLAFDFSVISKTTSDTFYFSTIHTFKNDYGTWGLLYLDDHVADISNKLYNPEEFLDYSKAMEEIEEYLAIDPYNSDFLFYRGECYARLKDVRQTEKCMEEAMRYSSVIYAYNYSPLGDVYRRTGDFEKAIENYKMAVSLSSNAADSSYYYTCVSFTMGLMNQKDSAAYYMKKAVELDYANTMVNFTLGDLHFDTGNPEQAIGHYDNYYEYDKLLPDSTSIYTRKNYVGYLLGRARLTKRNNVYLTYAKEICLTVNDGSKVIENYMAEIDELMDQNWSQ